MFGRKKEWEYDDDYGEYEDGEEEGSLREEIKDLTKRLRRLEAQEGNQQEKNEHQELQKKNVKLQQEVIQKQNEIDRLTMKVLEIGMVTTENQELERKIAEVREENIRLLDRIDEKEQLIESYEKQNSMKFLDEQKKAQKISIFDSELDNVIEKEINTIEQPQSVANDDSELDKIKETMENYLVGINKKQEKSEQKFDKMLELLSNTLKEK